MVCAGVQFGCCVPQSAQYETHVVHAKFALSEGFPEDNYGEVEGTGGATPIRVAALKRLSQQYAPGTAVICMLQLPPRRLLR